MSKETFTQWYSNSRIRNHLEDTFLVWCKTYMYVILVWLQMKFKCDVFFKDYPLEEVLCANYLISDWRPDIVEKVLEDLVPEKVRYFESFIL